MTISWFGLSSFKITSKELTIITDPFGNKTGLAPVKGAADVVICTSPKNTWSNNLSSISQNPFLIQGPGEFDVKGAFIVGTSAENNDLGGAVIYALEIEDMRIAFLGLLKQPQLTDTQKEVLEGSDIVLVPVGGALVLDAEQAGKIASQLEPYLIIPHTYKISGLTLELDKLDKFLKEMGGKAETLEKLTLKKKDLSGESTQVVILEPQR